MARYTEAKCRLCRREGKKLFLKGLRCTSPKCPIDKKGAIPPGMRSTKRAKKPSEYGLQLREKQKVKRAYGILETQLKKYFQKAHKTKGAAGVILLQILERRLDNVIYRLGFVPSRSVARQLVTHGHVCVNSKKVNIPSYQVTIGETISLSTFGMKNPQVRETFAEKSAIIPKWLEKKAAVGRIARLPGRDEIESDINEQLIVEYYSR